MWSRWRQCWRMITRPAEASEAGFSTLEVLVALTILATALVPLVQLQIESQRASRQLVRETQANRAIASALDHLHLFNPATAPQGRLNFGFGEVAWDSRLASADTSFVQAIGQEARIIGLYTVDVRIRSGEDTVYTGTWLKIGWDELQPAE